MQWIESEVHFEVLRYDTAKSGQYVLYLCFYYSVCKNYFLFFLFFYKRSTEFLNTVFKT